MARISSLQERQALGESRGLVFGGFGFSLLVHFGVMLGLYWMSVSKPKKDDFKPTAMTVSLAASMTTTAGKESKAPTAGATVQKKKKTEPQPEPPKPKPKPKKEPPKKAIGLDQDKKEKKKEEPKKKKAEPVVEKPEPKPVDPTPTPPEDAGETKASGGTGGEDEAGISFQVAAGPSQTDVPDVEFASYYSTIIGRVSQRWSRGSLKGGTSVIQFEIDRRGGVGGVKVIASAGKDHLDNAAKRAVLGAEFPPLPQGFAQEKMIIVLKFEYGDAR